MVPAVTFEDFLERMPYYTVRYLSLWANGIFAPSSAVIIEAPNNKFRGMYTSPAAIDGEHIKWDELSTYSHGETATVYQGGYLRGEKAGYPCVVKVFEFVPQP